MRKITVVGLAALAVGGWLAVPARSGDPPKAPPGVEYDFGTKVVSVRTSLKKTEGRFGFTAGYLQKVQVRRLGDRTFLVGEVAGRAGEDNPYAGVRLWVPLSAVLELGEFDDMDAVERVFKKANRPDNPGPAADGKGH